MSTNINPEIGKYTLESLTTGMYADPKIVYREYIQNSVDSLEDAVNMSIIEKAHMRIDITINEDEARITVRDNGTGVPSSKATQILLDIGNSQKKHTTNRGFRGIGRLGGMSYCDTLIFSTSHIDENVRTVITFDCKLLKQLLVPGEYEEYDLTRVLSEVTTVETKPEIIEEHYFIVDMLNVSDLSDLLDIQAAKKYISQVAPVPYSLKSFIWGSEIKKFMRELGLSMDEFPVFVGEGENDFEPVYKANKHRYNSDRIKRKSDDISSIEFFKVEDKDGLLAVGWYGNCNWFGTISESEVSGLRVRKGNILIGNSKTMNKIYREERFNGWVQGEIFVVSDKLLPNARRDDFEQTQAYYNFIDKLSETVGNDLSKIIREASSSRNDASAKVITEIEHQVKEVEKVLKEGFNSGLERTKFAENLQLANTKLARMKTSKPEAEARKQALLEKLNDTSEEIEENRNYKTNKINTGVDKKSRKIIELISDILSAYITKPLLDEIIDQIVKEVNAKG